ncbi:MAG: OstA-like protein [Gemmatimonadales bacterium]
MLIRCVGQETTIRADSMARYSDSDRLDFHGSVEFRDSTTSLDADWARYYTTDERLEAYDNVRLSDANTGSELTGRNLTYYREAAGVRDTAELYATLRPRVEYREGADPDLEPYVIFGDRVRLKGEGNTWAGGNVTIERSDFSAKGDSAALDMGHGEGMILGGAEASGRDSTAYTIFGSSIAFRLEGSRLNWIQARDSAVALSEEWEAFGDTIEFNIANELLQSGAVWGSQRRSEAVSSSQTIVADSLAIEAPNQVLTEIRGFRMARATTAQDSTQEEPDWIAGDTIVARFDSTEAGKRVLSMLVAAGQAQAFYHVFPEEGVEGPPALNYSRGRQITAYFKDEQLERVDILDEADGVYLEPLVRRPP